jgi:putative ABC transport system permease protein
MLRIALKGVRGHALRFLLTAASVTLGVALVAGTYILTDGIQDTFNRIVDQSVSRVDVQVRGVKSASGGQDQAGFGASRNLVDVGLARQLASVPGVQRARPDYQGSGVIAGKDGTPVRNGGAPTFAFAYWPDDPSSHLVHGRGPKGAGEIAVESATLSRSGLHVGDQTKALIGNQPETVTIVGDLKVDTAAGAAIVLVDPGSAARLFAADGTVRSISIKANPGVGQSELRTRVAAVLPPGAEAITRAELRQEARSAIDKALGFFTTFLLVFAGVSLFVGAFIIANTFSMLIAQRTRELALLRAVGASPGQVLRSVLIEALVVGLVGSAIGLAVGLALAAGLQVLLRVLLGLDSSGLPLLPRTVVVSVLIGTVVTVLSALLPAVRASRVAPVAAMRDDLAVTPRGLRLRTGLGLALLAAGVGSLLSGVLPSDPGWWYVSVGAVLTVVGTLVLAPTAARPLVRVLAWPFVLLTGVVGRLARENSLRTPRRTAATASALMIGLALIGAIGTIASSTKASVASIVEEQLTADYVLSTGGQAVMPPTVARQVAALPGVRTAAPISLVQVRLGNDQTFASAVDADAFAGTVNFHLVSGSLSGFTSGAVMVDESTAKADHLSAGSTLQAAIGHADPRATRVVGVFKDNPALGTGVLVSRADYRRSVPLSEQGDGAILVKAAPSTQLDQLRTRLVNEVKPFLVVSVQNGEEFTNSQADQVNTLLNLLYVLLALSVVIAVLGIINTLALSVFERTREIGLLRAVGLSRRQLQGMITVESVATAVFGAVLGTVLGVSLGVALQHALRHQGLPNLSIPWSTIASVLVLSAVAGVVAAALPAWRAVRLDVLRAITTE